MKKTSRKSFSAWLKSWDQGNFDFTSATLDVGKPLEDTSDHSDKSWEKEILQGVEKAEYSFFSAFYPVAAVFLSVILIAFLLLSVVQLPPYGSADTPANSNEVVARYVEKGMEETGAVNVVAGVILDYRAFDTLGESHVLFTAAMAVFILLLSDRERKESFRSREILFGDTVLRSSTKILVSLLLVFGIYIILCGHLGPGGGFSGGAVVGGGLILFSAAFGPERLSRILGLRNYRIVTCSALSFYSLSKCYSFFCGANGLHSIFGPGKPGRILSAGLILPLNIAVGIVVACTMYGFYSLFTRRSI